MVKRLTTLAAIAAVTLTAAPAAGATVASRPTTGTPHLTPNGHVEIVRQLARCGRTMYAVGSFTKIGQRDRTITRRNAFSFQADKPFTITRWNPNVNGEVNSIAFADHCRTAYLGGDFTIVHGTHATNIAAVSTRTGTLEHAFAHDASAPVETVRDAHGHLIAGGYFQAINGSHRALLASLSPRTGRDDGFIPWRVTGSYHYRDFRGTASDPPRVYNQQVSHNGRYDLIEGVFTHLGATPRQQIAMINVTGKRATVTGWTSREFDHHCASVESFYVRSAAWSSDDSRVFTASTGYRYDLPNGARGGPPMKYLCDSAAAFPAAQHVVRPLWINYTGCDSLYSAGEAGGVAFFGGHERWSENPRGCDFKGPGAINAPGIEGLSPVTGKLVKNPTRARGVGADSMITYRGLWIASDNYGGNATMCGGEQGFAGICYLAARPRVTGRVQRVAFERPLARRAPGNPRCHVWAYALWRGGDWAKGTGSLHGCGGYVKVILYEYRLHPAGWVVESSTGFKFGGAGVRNYSQARCKYWGTNSDTRTWIEETIAQYPNAQGTQWVGSAKDLQTRLRCIGHR